MSILYTASQCPVPLTPSAPPSQAACTDSTSTAPGAYIPQASGSAFDPQAYNQFLAQSAASFLSSGGYGVLSGCTLTVPGSGLLLPISAGYIACMGAIPIVATTAVCPDNTALVFVWALQNGTVSVTTTTTAPSLNCVYIGNCTTLSGNITTVDYSAVCYCQGGNLIRTTADRSAPTDTPNAGTAYHTIVQSGAANAPVFHWNGVNYNSLNPTTNALNWNATLTGDLTLLPQDNGFSMNLIASGANKNVFLPDPATLPTGWRMSLFNAGTSHSLVLKDSTGVSTLATLTTTDLSLNVFTYIDPATGLVAFPGGVWAPGPIPTPGRAS